MRVVLSWRKKWIVTILYLKIKLFKYERLRFDNANSAPWYTNKVNFNFCETFMTFFRYRYMDDISYGKSPQVIEVLRIFFLNNLLHYRYNMWNVLITKIKHFKNNSQYNLLNENSLFLYLFYTKTLCLSLNFYWVKIIQNVRIRMLKLWVNFNLYHPKTLSDWNFIFLIRYNYYWKSLEVYF